MRLDIVEDGRCLEQSLIENVCQPTIVTRGRLQIRAFVALAAEPTLRN
jgi:hypothetical protein